MSSAIAVRPLAEVPTNLRLSAAEETRIQAWTDEANKVMAQLEPYEIKSDDDAQSLSERLRPMRQLQQHFKKAFEQKVQKYHKQHCELTARRNTYLDPLKALDRTIKDKIGVWERKRKFERMREQQEAQRQAEEDARKAQEQTAQAVEKSGDVERAQAIREEPIAPVTAPIVAEPTYAGVSIKPTYTYEITNLQALPRNLLMPDERAITEFVKRNGPLLAAGRMKVPGLKVTESTSVRGTR